MKSASDADGTFVKEERDQLICAAWVVFAAGRLEIHHDELCQRDIKWMFFLPAIGSCDRQRHRDAEVLASPSCFRWSDAAERRTPQAMGDLLRCMRQLYRDRGEGRALSGDLRPARGLLFRRPTGGVWVLIRYFEDQQKATARHGHISWKILPIENHLDNTRTSTVNLFAVVHPSFRVEEHLMAVGARSPTRLAISVSLTQTADRTAAALARHSARGRPLMDAGSAAFRSTRAIRPQPRKRCPLTDMACHVPGRSQARLARRKLALATCLAVFAWDGACRTLLAGAQNFKIGGDPEGHSWGVASVECSISGKFFSPRVELLRGPNGSKKKIQMMKGRRGSPPADWCLATCRALTGKQRAPKASQSRSWRPLACGGLVPDPKCKASAR